MEAHSAACEERYDSHITQSSAQIAQLQSELAAAKQSAAAATAETQVSTHSYTFIALNYIVQFALFMSSIDNAHTQCIYLLRQCHCINLICNSVCTSSSSSLLM
jgi:hypothetical protein